MVFSTAAATPLFADRRTNSSPLGATGDISCNLLAATECAITDYNFITRQLFKDAEATDFNVIFSHVQGGPKNWAADS